MKEDILKRAKDDESVLVLEFDYAQNRPLPKLNINSLSFIKDYCGFTSLTYIAITMTPVHYIGT